MPIDYDALTSAGLERMHPGSAWDVVCSVEEPGLPVCMPYPSLDVANAALRSAGFEPCRHPVTMAPSDGTYDFTTAMRMADSEGHGVVLIRRVGS